MRRAVQLCTLAFSFAAIAAGSTSPALAADGDGLTYCNPIVLPDYPIGREARTVVPGTPVNANNPGLWLLGQQEQFRELADVSVVWFDNKWYMYPSVDMAWVSSDGVNWEHHPLNVRDVGYAPTVVRHKGRFLLMASANTIYASESPLGPFESIGQVRLPAGTPSMIDPMLFSDDDGKLYLYWGCTPDQGIYVVELDANAPAKVISGATKVIPFEPQKYPWQRRGDWNEDVNVGWPEGSWMIKRNGTYYLTYSVGGTENRTYCVAALTSKSPLGPFTYQKDNPILRTTEGLITGTSHGSFVEGPNGSLWAFYTLRAAVVHGFERRLGMDPAWIGEDGELHVHPASSTPMRMTGDARGAVPTGWLPLNANRNTRASSTAPNLTTRLAVDNDLRTWWQPAEGDTSPTLTTALIDTATVDAVRVVWRDIGLNTNKGIVAGPYRYQVQLQTAPGQWKTVIDRSASEDDLLVDYRQIEPTKANSARLVIDGAPKGITPGVAEFTVFGNTTPR